LGLSIFMMLNVLVVKLKAVHARIYIERVYLASKI
jgi:hypothetical protein